jgi:hypothetical protein
MTAMEMEILNQPIVSCGSFSDTRRKSLSVRIVPFAEVNPGILNGSYRKS